MPLPILTSPVTPDVTMVETATVPRETTLPHFGFDLTRQLGPRSLSTLDVSWSPDLTVDCRNLWGFLKHRVGTGDPFSWVAPDPIDDPSGYPATLTQVTSGSQGSRSYNVVFTYYDATGETLQSAQSTLAVLANNVMVVTIPALVPIGATGWRVYVDNDLQASISSGLVWQEPDAGTITGVAPPTANNLSPAIAWMLASEPKRTRRGGELWTISARLSQQPLLS